MAGRGYSIFDTAIGRCGIAWGELGVVGVQLPEAREIETRRRLFQLYPEAREQRPPLNAEIAIEGIVALLRGGAADFSEVILEMTGIPGFNQRVYAVRPHASRAARPVPIAKSPPRCALPARPIRWRRRSPKIPS